MDTDPLRKHIRKVPDFPKRGVLFYDITTLLKDEVGFATQVDHLSSRTSVSFECCFVPVRKPGKLPAERVKYDYAVERGTSTLEIHKDAIQKGQRVLIVDDLLATGAAAQAAASWPRPWAAKSWVWNLW